MSETVYSKLRWIAERAKQHPDEPFKNLAYLIDVDFLREAYYLLNEDSLPGCDKQTWEDYQEELETNLADLHERLKTMRYRAQPVERIWLDKEDGKKRPIGIPVLEDKIVQKAVTMILEAIYERMFYSMSYGFRRGRSQQGALRALREQCMGLKMNWILDADVSGFFDSIDHELLMECLHRRIVDTNLLRLIKKFLNAGVLEEGQLSYPETGTPQGGIISPMLANIFMHYVLDEWIYTDLLKRMPGRIFATRFADDFVIGFRLKSDADKIMEELKERFAAHKLTIHPEKTKLIKFGRPLSRGASHSGNGTFDFLGFTHYWAKSRRGNWVIKRKTARKRLSRSMKSLWRWCRNNRHEPIKWQHQQLCQKLKGHYGYYGVPCNMRSMQNVLEYAQKAWHYWLSRRSHRASIHWAGFARMLERYQLPSPRIVHRV